MPVRRHAPIMAVPRHHTYSSPRHDYGIDESLHRADFLSNAVLEDTFDAASRSRNKDKDLLRNVNSALISTEIHESPRSAVVSRRVRASTAPPSPRPPPGYQAHAQAIKVAAAAKRSSPWHAQTLPRPVLATRTLSPSPDVPSTRPAPYYYVYVPPADLARYRSSHYHASTSSSLPNTNQPLSKPVVLLQGPLGEKPWYLQRAARARSAAREQTPSRAARGASVPPRSARGVSMPPMLPPESLPTARLKASSRRVPPALLKARARSLDRGEVSGFPAASSAPARGKTLPTQQLWAHRPPVLAKDAALAARARADPRNPYSSRLRRSTSEPRQLDRGSGSHHSYYYPSLPYSYYYYHRVPDASERALSKHVYSHRGRFGPESKPPRPSLANFPQVYVPWNGPGPSNRAKAAIIGSKMEPEGRASRKGPRSQFAQNKMREMRLDDLERKYH